MLISFLKEKTKIVSEKLLLCGQNSKTFLTRCIHNSYLLLKHCLVYHCGFSGFESKATLLSVLWCMIYLDHASADLHCILGKSTEYKTTSLPPVSKKAGVDLGGIILQAKTNIL